MEEELWAVEGREVVVLDATVLGAVEGLLGMLVLVALFDRAKELIGGEGSVGVVGREECFIADLNVGIGTDVV